MVNKLFEPINIGTVEVRNRLVIPAMATNYADSSGFVTQRLIDYYVERAKNNVGLIIIEETCIALGGKIIVNQLGVYDDAFIPGLRKLAEAIGETGTRCFLQLHHGGRRAQSKINNGLQPIAPSAIPHRTGEMPHELTLEEIDNLIEAYAQGARRAKEAGFDGVEGHFAHGYLVAQFLSPLTNKRTDKYGGDLASRVRFGIEIIQRIRQRAGEDYPLSTRICGDEYIKGGLTLKDTQKVAVMLEEAGVNVINVSAGYTASHEEGYLNALIPYSFAPMSIPHGFYAHLAEGIKKVVKVPVIAVGRLDDPDVAEEIIAKGKADMVAIGRGFLADPAFASKVYNKQYGDIRKCIACGECGHTALVEGNLRCAVNAELGKEEEYRIKPAPEAKRVVVIGGGPGGMEAAKIAALRGHKVTLVERKSRLGGNMVAAATPSFKHEINNFIDYLSNAVHKAGVEVSLNTEADQEKVLALKPDAVILATGASPQMPAIPGMERNNVTDAVQVLEGKAKTGSKVIVAGAGAVGCETAAFLAESGKEVTIVEMRDTDFSETDGLAPDMNSILRRWFLFELWPNLPIEVIGKSTFKEVTDKGLIVQNREGEQKLIAGDTIVLAAGMKSNNNLKEKLQGKVPELYEVGDCVTPRHIIDAVDDAARIARLI